MFEERFNIQPTELRRHAGPILGGALLLVLGLGSMFAYSMHQRTVARQLTIENQVMSSTLKETRDQIEVVTARLNALSIAQQKQAVVEARRAQVERRLAERAAAEGKSLDDVRWQALQQVQGKLGDYDSAISSNKNDIASTRQDLVNARLALEGSIARTHGDIVMLQKKGERSYFEFDVLKSKNFQHAGPIGIQLRKADTKHDYADMDLMVEDIRLQQKHVNIYQPVMFYAADSGQPVELVINNISKNHIHGYISAPKYRQAELAAMQASDQASSGTVSADGTSSTPLPRRKLELPQ